MLIHSKSGSTTRPSESLAPRRRLPAPAAAHPPEVYSQQWSFGGVNQHVDFEPNPPPAPVPAPYIIVEEEIVQQEATQA